MGEASDEIDWNLTTWEGSRRAPLRRALTLTVRERMEALEGLADVARCLREIHTRGAFEPASQDSGGPLSKANAYQDIAACGDQNG